MFVTWNVVIQSCYLLSNLIQHIFVLSKVNILDNINCLLLSALYCGVQNDS
jgi:hypothetical protein